MTWLLIDGNNWFAQCDFACAESSDVTFIKRLRTVFQQIPNERCVICWDCGKSFRCGLDPSYKAHRDHKPDGFHTRLARTRQQVDEFPSVESLSSTGYEADDCIATLVAHAHHEGEQAIVFSADRDLHQLLSPGTVTQVTKVQRVSGQRMNFNTVSADRLVDQFGVLPSQWIDYRVIVGDTSDGIKGVPGLGPKAARELLQWGKSLDVFYRDPWKSPLANKQMQSLIAFRDQLAGKRRLLTLVNSVPVPATQMS